MNTLTPARVTMLMFLVVGGLVAAYVAKTLLAVDEKPPEAPQTRTIPLPISDIAPGTIITAAHLGSARIKVEDIDPATLMNERVIIGRMAKEALPAARPIHSNQLYPPNQFPSLEVAEGMRAVSVDLAPTTSLVDGLIKPGQFADVHMTVTNLSNTQDTRSAQLRGGLTMTLFKGVRVLAINRVISVPQIDTARNTVTLELSPMQANVMILARERGDITLTYTPDGQGAGGIAVANVDKTNFEEILGLDPIPQPPKPFRAEIYRGRQRERLEFGGGVRASDIDDYVPPPTQVPFNGQGGPGPQGPIPNGQPVPYGPNVPPADDAPPAAGIPSIDEPTADDYQVAPSV